MIANFNKPETQLDLFRKLNAGLLLADAMHDGRYRYPGVYAIFQGDTCMYVGQSGNIASRLATHMFGKYKSCDRIDLYLAEGTDSFEDFLALSRKDQKFVLETNEAFLIQKLKPIENLLVDFDKEPDQSHLFWNLREVTEAAETRFISASVYCTDLSVSVSTNECDEILRLPKRCIQMHTDYAKAHGVNVSVLGD